MLTIEQITRAAQAAAREYPIKSIVLFGSYAGGTSTEDSDVDLLVEFFDNDEISLLTLVSLKNRLEELINKEVDVIHAPIPENSILEIERTVTLYAA